MQSLNCCVTVGIRSPSLSQRGQTFGPPALTGRFLGGCGPAGAGRSAARLGGPVNARSLPDALSLLSSPSIWVEFHLPQNALGARSTADMMLVHFGLGAGMAPGERCWLFLVVSMTTHREVTDGSSLSPWDANPRGHQSSFMWLSHLYTPSH